MAAYSGDLLYFAFSYAFARNQAIDNKDNAGRDC